MRLIKRSRDHRVFPSSDHVTFSRQNHVLRGRFCYSWRVTKNDPIGLHTKPVSNNLSKCDSRRPLEMRLFPSSRTPKRVSQREATCRDYCERHDLGICAVAQNRHAPLFEISLRRNRSVGGKRLLRRCDRCRLRRAFLAAHHVDSSIAESCVYRPFTV